MNGSYHFWSEKRYPVNTLEIIAWFTYRNVRIVSCTTGRWCTQLHRENGCPPLVTVNQAESMLAS
jgi:hypothetical protein